MPVDQLHDKVRNDPMLREIAEAITATKDEAADGAVDALLASTVCIEVPRHVTGGLTESYDTTLTLGDLLTTIDPALAPAPTGR